MLGGNYTKLKVISAAMRCSLLLFVHGISSDLTMLGLRRMSHEGVYRDEDRFGNFEIHELASVFPPLFLFFLLLVLSRPSGGTHKSCQLHAWKPSVSKFPSLHFRNA